MNSLSSAGRRHHFGQACVEDSFRTEDSDVRDHVLDATALLCVLFAEEGCERIEPLLPRSLISTVNHHEVLVTLIDFGLTMADARMVFEELDVEIVAVDRIQAEVASSMLKDSRGQYLSLGERSCLALARALDAVAVTTDSQWARVSGGVKIMISQEDSRSAGTGK